MGTDGSGGSGGSGGVLAVDTVELHEVAQRLRRAGEDLAVAGEGIDGLQRLGGLAVGADAVQDALADLARQWSGSARWLRDDAIGLELALEQARAAYESCEGRVSGLVCLRDEDGPAR